MVEDSAELLSGHIQESAQRHLKAKDTILTAAEAALGGEGTLEEKWSIVVEGVASRAAETLRLPAPAFTEAVAEVLYDKYGATDQSLDSTMALADSWLSAVGREASGELRFQPLLRIMHHGSLRAASQDDSMMRELYQGFSELFTDLAYPSGHIWSSIVSIRKALSHTRARTLQHRDMMMVICELCQSFDPYSLDRSKGIVEINMDDREWISKFPKAEGLGRMFGNLDGKQLKKFTKTPESITEGSPFLNELAGAVVHHAQQRVNEY